MIKIYDDNGLPFFDQTWIRDRQYAESVLADTMRQVLINTNPAWQFHQIEAPCLIPRQLVSDEYQKDDYYQLALDATAVLKPETTGSSYQYAQYLLAHQAAKPPLCVYQASKSFRRENDQVAKNVRLKEFYQMEFQCIVTDDTKMDYQNNSVLDNLAHATERLTGKLVRRGHSDRLPKYSEQTIDLEVCIRHVDKGTGVYDDTKEKWLEICSISKRTDVPFAWEDRKLINYEFAFGLDRIVHAMHK